MESSSFDEEYISFMYGDTVRYFNKGIIRDTLSKFLQFRVYHSISAGKLQNFTHSVQAYPYSTVDIFL